MYCLQVLISSLITFNILGINAAYNQIISYDPRYMIRRVPVRRSVDFESRIQTPITRYFPQVDAQVAPYPYVAAQETVAPAAYRLPSGEVYVLPSRWSDEAIPVQQQATLDDNDYGTYDYDSDLNPVYGRTYQSEPYAIQQAQDIGEVPMESNDGDLYNDMMVNYFLTGLQPDLEENEFSEVQRRSQEVPNTYGVANSIEHQQEQKKDQTKASNESGSQKQLPSTPATQEASTAVPTVSPSVSAAAVPAPASTPSPLKVRQPIQRFPQFSMARRSQAATQQQNGGQWSPYMSTQQGQKEYPIYRQPSGPAQKSPMASLEEQMSRGKNTSNKSKQDAFSLIEKMMSSQHGSDPLTEQLESLKFRNM